MPQRQSKRRHIKREMTAVKLTRLLAAAGLAALTLTAAPVAATAAPAPLKVVGHFPGPDGGWDYVNYDEARNKIYITRGSTVMVIDLATGKTNPHFSEGKRLHAAVPVPGTDEILLTDSGDNTAKFINATTGAVMAVIPTPKDADGAIYDAQTGYVLVGCGDGTSVVVIDAKAMKSVGVIDIGSPVEFLAVDGNGHGYINEEEKNQVAAFDLATLKVTASWPLPDCQRPTGLVYGEGQLVSVCGNGRAVILDAATGKVLASLKIGFGPDAALYNPRLKTAYVPSGVSGDLAVIPLTGPQKDTVVQTVATHIGARTGAVDTKTGRIYLPAAEYMLPAPAGKRPQPKPGSFQVLVVGPH
jgi:DNA-binding beta-propeller fold protein YncE